MTEPEPDPKLSPIANIIGGIVLISLAGYLGYWVWFLIDDAVGDWCEAYGPQSSDQAQPSWFYAFRQACGLSSLLFFLPSIALAITGYFMIRSAVRQFRFHARAQPQIRNA